MVKLAVDDGVVVLDPFYGGVSLGTDDLNKRLQLAVGSENADRLDLVDLLGSVSKTDILARILRNLKAIYLQKNALERALTTANQILALDSESSLDIRDRGLILENLECPAAAVSDYQHYLHLAPKAKDQQSIRERISKLSGTPPRRLH